MSKIKMTINNREVEAYEGQTVLEAAKNNGIHIPTLCYLKDVTGTGACSTSFRCKTSSRRINCF